MTSSARVPVTAGLLALLVCSATGCNQLRANDKLNRGVAEFKNAHYEQAENYFQQAQELAPNDPKPRLYLATTFASQVVPGSTSADNMKYAQKAIDGFQDVLSRDPNDVQALKQIASLDLNTGKTALAKEYQGRVLKLAPDDSEAWYTVGVIDFKDAYKNTVDALAAEGMTDKGDGNVKLSKGACAKLVVKNTPLVTEGTADLQKSVDINPNYEEAMTYLSLMSRRKADIECGNPVAVKADLATADQWAQRSMGARKANEAKKEEKLKGGVTQ